MFCVEWFISYYKEAKATYGARAKDPKTRGKMTEGICEAGEIFFVPSGYWHSPSFLAPSFHQLIIVCTVVVNLEPSIAVTQNFVSRRELPKVLNFMKYRPEQVSGFKLQRPAVATTAPNDAQEIISGLDECDETVSGIYESFCEALARERGELSRDALAAMEGTAVVVGEKDEQSVASKGLWEKVTDVVVPFSFAFFEAGSEEDEEVV